MCLSVLIDMRDNAKGTCASLYTYGNRKEVIRVHVHQTSKKYHEQIEFKVCGTEKYWGRSARSKKI